MQFRDLGWILRLSVHLKVAFSFERWHGIVYLVGVFLHHRGVAIPQYYCREVEEMVDHAIFLWKIAYLI